MKNFGVRNIIMLLLSMALLVSVGMVSSQSTLAVAKAKSLERYMGASLFDEGVEVASISTSEYVQSVETVDIFYNFTSWQHSTTQKQGDMLAQFIYQFKGPYTTGFNTDTFIHNTHNLMDVNGDGLTDMIYQDMGLQNMDNMNSSVKMAMWLNKGNNIFELAYKCVVDADSGWYGDCAASE